MKTVGNFTSQRIPSFPHDCELYEGLQENMAIISILGNVVGDKIILCGCELENMNTQHTDGYIFMRTVDYPDGEILYCESGSIDSGLYLKKEITEIELLDKKYDEAYVTRTLAPGSKGSEKYSWNEFSRLISTPELDKMIQDYIQAAEQQHATLKKQMEEEIADLNGKYTSLKTETSENLKTVKSEIEGKLSSLGKSLDDEIEALTDYVDKQDKELEGKITSQVSGLNTTIQEQIKGVEGQISSNYSTLENRDTQIEGKISALQTQLTNGSITAQKAVEAGKLSTARTIKLTGDVSGEVAFDGSKNVDINTKVDSSAHLVNSNANNSAKVKIWIGTDAEYRAINPKDNNTIYHIL